MSRQRSNSARAGGSTSQKPDTGISTTPLDLSGADFPSEPAALAMGVRVAREWIEDNAVKDEKKAGHPSR